MQRNGDKTMRKWMMAILAFSTTTTVARAQDPAAGQNTFALCTICHAVGEGAQNKLGPILNGLDSRRSGSVPGYDYSEAMKNTSIVWAKRPSRNSSLILERRCLARKRPSHSTEAIRKPPICGHTSNNSDRTAK
jgi:hypothetical protein